ncbi:MAG: type IX secretion system protein PorQ [Prevotella sp.]|nr:type IX secretion system protein PorQ [Prevotella sp.]MBQ6208631.1 type IX secretion system protein PorQ [Prevotella sp.]
MKKVLFSILLLVFVSSLDAQESQTSYNFLRLPISAHAAALGGDNVTLIEDDASLIFHNPALLYTVEDKTVLLNYMNYMSGANTASAAFTKIIKEKASVAASAQYINYGKMKEMTADNVQVGDFSAKDIALCGYFSYLLTNKLTGGITAKFITSYIGEYNSIAMGVDLGLNYYDPEKDFSVGLVVKNLGGQLKAYNDDYEPMPIDLQAGVSKRLTHTPFRFSLTLVDLNHWDYKFIKHVTLGADIILSPQIWVGAGYNFRRGNEITVLSADGNESSHGAGFTLGGGINLDRFKLNLAYGKYHVSSSSILVNVAFNL